MITSRSPLVPKDQSALAARRFSRWMERQGLKVPAVARQLAARLTPVHQARIYEFISRHHITEATLSAIAGLMTRSAASLLAPERPRRSSRRRSRLGQGVPVYLTAEQMALLVSAVDRVHANTTAGKNQLAGLRSMTERIGKLLLGYLSCRFASSASFQRAVVRNPSASPLPKYLQSQHLIFSLLQGPPPAARRRRVLMPTK